MKTYTIYRNALETALDALCDLCEHPAFADDAPEFNQGGVGYEAGEQIRDALAMCTTCGGHIETTFMPYRIDHGLLTCGDCGQRAVDEAAAERAEHLAPSAEGVTDLF